MASIFLHFFAFFCRFHFFCHQACYRDAFNLKCYYMSALTIRFQLFGIPVSIHPLSWLFLAILGGALSINTSMDLVSTLLFVVAGMISLLCHEFGHALTAQKLAGASPTVNIEGMGGHATLDGARFTRWTYFSSVLAGPIGGMLPAVLMLIFICMKTGMLWLPIKLSVLSSFSFLLPDGGYLAFNQFADILMVEGGLSVTMFLFTLSVFFVCYVWTLLNLLPIFPLDGSKLLGTLLRNDLLAARIGLVVSVLLLFWAVQTKEMFMMLISGYLAYMNYQHYKSLLTKHS